MKKLSLLLALLMMLAMLGACGGTPATSTSGAASTSTSTSTSEEEIFFDPSQLQVTAVDDLTLEVKLVAPTPYFLELTAFPTYSPVPQHMIDEYGEAWATEAASYIGNGPYKVTEWVPSSHITMEKNENYWEVDTLGPEKIIFNLIEDDVSQYNAYQAGELAFIDSVPTSEIAALKDNPEFYSPAQMGTYYVSFNNEVAPFDNALVREAFSLAIDREHIAGVIGDGLYTAAGAWIPPSLNDAQAGTKFRDVGGDFWDPTGYEANLEKAKELLAEAGYPNGEGLPVIEYIYNPTDLHEGVAEALQDMWGELGATVEVSAQEWATFTETRNNGEYMAARDGWLNDYNDPVGMLDMFTSSAIDGNNHPRYNNPEYDSLISQVKTSSDANERFELMHQAESLLMEDHVFAPIMYYADPYMQKSDLTGVWASPLGYKYLMYAEGYEELPVCLGPNTASIDPALNTTVDGASMVIHAFEGLYRLDKNGVPEPAAAESVDISDDGLTYTFHLREGLTWSDGTPLTANDFVYSWTRAINPETAADYAYMYDVIAGYSEALGGEGGH